MSERIPSQPEFKPTGPQGPEGKEGIEKPQQREVPPYQASDILQEFLGEKRDVTIADLESPAPPPPKVGPKPKTTETPPYQDILNQVFFGFDL